MPGLLLAWCSAATQAAPQTITVVSAASGKPVGDAVVSVYVKGVPGYAAAGKTADMGQREKNFVPTLLAVQVGTSVNFPNFDTVRHHVYSFSPTKSFEIKLYAGTPSKPVVFDKPGTATLGCNIHDKMVSHIHVVETPYFGITNRQGEVTLDLPEGSHRVRIWGAVLSESQPGIEQALKTGAPAVIRVPF
jgi:plastocyanin